jgi:hypothetical protein
VAAERAQVGRRRQQLAAHRAAALDVHCQFIVGDLLLLAGWAICDLRERDRVAELNGPADGAASENMTITSERESGEREAR